MIYSVLGSNYGDEGKGLATDYLSCKSKHTLVVRHNGGAQSGHTVEIKEKRFVFHELSSGSFRGADTYWADSFLPDMYKLSEEIEGFRQLTGFVPRVYVSSRTCITTIDDILTNMLLEAKRGDTRHGSCGMGINEADLRNKAGFEIRMGDLFLMDSPSLFERLKEIREKYTVKRLSLLGMDDCTSNEYLAMLVSDEVLWNFSEHVIDNKKYISSLREPDALFNKYENIIFENGQGLRLDAEFEENWPHVTASRTGLTNVLRILSEADRKLDEAVYVTRSYLTKHGAGFIKNEDEKLGDELNISDSTNVPNEWQGRLRFARWDDIGDFLRVMKADTKNCDYDYRTSLMITHLNETDRKMLLQDGSVSVQEFMRCDELREFFDGFYLSETRFAEDIMQFI